MASRFWVGSGSANTWAATANTNWATSSGGSNNATVPGTSDLAIFDGGSGTGNSVIGANITVQGLDCTGGTGNYAGTLTHNTGVTLTINTGAASSLRFSAGMTYSPAATSSLITFTHTSGTANITSAGQKLFALTINGAGGTTQTLDALLVNAGTNAVLTVTSGIFDANNGSGGPFAVTANILNFSGSTTRSVILGGTVTVGGAVGTNNIVWGAATTTALTFTKNSANIVVLAPTTAVTFHNFAGGGLTYNQVTFNATTNAVSCAMTGNNTFANWNVNSGWSFQLNASLTVSNAFTWTGTQAKPIMLYPAASGLNTISVATGTCTLIWGGLMNVTASGGATFTATNVFDFGNNSGWSITPPADETAITPAKIATAVWQDTTAGDFAVAGSIAQQLWRGVAGSATGVRGTVTTGSSTTSVHLSALTLNGSAASGVVANQFAWRNVLFDTNTTTAGLQGAVSAISASSASNTPTLTVAALPATPASTDSFSII